MTIVTGLTAERMLAIEAASIVDGEVVVNNLILTKFDESTIDAGNVRGPQGIQGLGPGMIPGEIRLWPSIVLPDIDDYSLWVWANGASYVIADHPIAAANIDDLWNTFDGASSPGGGNFRVPDLRGLVPAGLDQMPEGSSANRMTRAAADTLGSVTGEEEHALDVTEIPSHHHGGSLALNPETYPNGNLQQVLSGATYSGATVNSGNTGGGVAHENVQPTVMMGYIVCLDGS